MIRFGNRPPLIRRSVPAHKSLVVRNVVPMLSHRVISKGTVVRGHPVVWSLVLRPDHAKQDPVVVYGTKFGVRSVPGGGSTYCIHTEGLRLHSLLYKQSLTP